jgi:hypothetical protein
MTSNLTEAVRRFEAEHEFYRLISIPQEDWSLFTTAKWQGSYRWFRSPNVVCLEKYRAARDRDLTKSPAAIVP